MRFFLVLSYGGFLASLIVHILTFFGFSPAGLRRGGPLSEVHPIWLLHAVAFIAFGAAFGALMFSPRGPLSSTSSWAPVSAWSRWLVVSLVLYAGISLVAHVTAGGQTVGSGVARVFSAFWLAFFAGASVLLRSYCMRTSHDRNA